tara:strand:- start:268 stop:693 length:426 start_codon:yes stop_codon:yes gene_type:complete
MNNVNANKDDNVKLVKNFIKDLSFENPQDIIENNVFDKNNSNFDVRTNVFYKPYNKKFFSLLLKYTFECSLKENKKKLFNLELEYFGLFEILKKNYNQEELTKNGINTLFPFVKDIVEHITKRGGSIIVSLNEIDFDLIKN